MKIITITKDEIKTQTDAIKWHLKNYGSITSLQAIKEYGATRLASIIFNLKQDGYNIHSTDLEFTTRFGRRTTISKYLYMKPTPTFEQKLIWG
tara:strand:+ start:1674 stop:1952 length:279 start_codon:yes stop_codon:yes gene_type:complete